MRDAARHGCAISDDDWRRSIWQTMKASQSYGQDPDWYLVAADEQGVAECISEAVAK